MPIETPRRGDIWKHRENSAIKALVIGRSEDQVVVESDSTFINGRKAFSLALFIRHFELEARP